MNKLKRLPIIKVRDKNTGVCHIVGQDIHDALEIENGAIHYTNIQCMSGTRFDDAGYEFIKENEEMFCNIAFQDISDSDRVAKLERALDKACERLEIEHNYPYDDLQTKEDWKEWCLDEI